MYCPSCQREIPDGSRFCQLCSRPIETTIPEEDQRYRLPTDFAVPEITGLGQLLAVTFRVWWKNLPQIAVLVLTVWAPVNFGLAYLLYALNAQDNFWFSWRLGALAETVFGALAVPAVIYALIEKMRSGRRAGIGECYRWGTRQWGKVFRATFMSGLWIGGGLILLVVPGIVLWVGFMLTDAVATIEADEQSDVLRRSRDLTKGRRWMLLGGGLLVFAFVMSIYMLIMLPTPEHWIVTALTDCVFETLFALMAVLELMAYLGFVQAERIARGVSPQPLPSGVPEGVVVG